MRHALLDRQNVAFGEGARFVVRIGHQDCAETAGQIDDNVDARRTQTVDHLLEKYRVPATFACLGVAHVNMHDARSRLCRLDAGGSDLRWGDRHLDVLAVERRVPRHRACKNDLATHHASHSRFPLTAINSPVIFPAAGEQRKSTVSASSDGSI
jgi:hypothetical protein